MSTLSTIDESKYIGGELGASSSGHSQIEKVLQSISRVLSQYSLGIAAVWVCVVGIAMLGFSRQKPLWADEVIFRWIATLPSVREIWVALKLGLNTDPPLAHVLTHGLTTVFGSGALILRLTSLGGICVMLACLFLTLRKYVGSLYALLGLVLPFSTMMVEYGYEARPYGLMYGCFGLAIYCWSQAGEEGGHRIAWNVGLGLALAAALACHFYSVFALPAFYLGEAVRARRRRRLSWPTTVAIAGASASVLLYWPIIVNARQYSSSYFEKPNLWSVPSMLERSLDQLVIPLFAFLAIVAIFATLGVHFTRENRTQESVPFRELAALGLGFLLLPVIAWGAGMLVLKAFTTRYVLHGLFGVFLLVPLFAARVFRWDRLLGLALLVACGLPGLLFVERGTVRALKAPVANGDLTQLQTTLPKLSGDIVVSDPHLLIELVNYSPGLKDKCIYLWDGENEKRYTGQDGFSHFAGAELRMKWFRSAAWSSYPSKDSAFLVLTVPDGEPDGLGWMRGHLEAAHRYGEVIAKPGHYLVVEAKPSEVVAAR